VASIAHAQPSARDPRINGSINVNGLINPRINGSINPRVNGSINPSVNGSINPRINSSINPNYSRDIRGYYVWGINGNVIGIIVIVNKDFLVMFSGSECGVSSQQTRMVASIFSMSTRYGSAISFRTLKDNSICSAKMVVGKDSQPSLRSRRK
jgi:hypothetical protein